MWASDSVHQRNVKAALGQGNLEPGSHKPAHQLAVMAERRGCWVLDGL